MAEKSPFKVSLYKKATRNSPTIDNRIFILSFSEQNYFLRKSIEVEK